MTDERLPFIRGEIDAVEKFTSARGGGGSLPSLPSRDPKKHRKYLTDQLDHMATRAKSRRAGARDPEASRELIAVSPAAGQALAADSLGDERKDVRVVGEDPDTRTVLLDAPSADLPALRKKLDQYVDPKKASKSGVPRNAPLVSPIQSIGLAGVADIAPPGVRAAIEEAAEWLAIGCRGGRYDEHGNAVSRREITRQLRRLTEARAPAAEYVAAMEVVFYAKLTLDQLSALVDAVDCVYEVQLAERSIRDWLFLEHDRPDLSSVRVEGPPPRAPAVVLLDTGVKDDHPLLAPAIRSATSVVPGIASGVDVDGHGTEMAGVALYLDGVGDAIQRGVAVAPHLLQSVKINTDESDSQDEASRALWAPMTLEALEQAERHPDPTGRAFTMAITAPIEPLEPIDWSQAVEQLAWNEGRGRLVCISAGNAHVEDASLIRDYPDLNLIQSIEDPAQAWNALTVGACTWRTAMPPTSSLSDYRPVAPAGGISPHATARPVTADRVPNKPEVVFEGGNVAFDGALPDPTVPTLTTLTTGHSIGRPLASMWGTSEATARAGHLAARIWSEDATLTPATVRGLIVHSASWTPRMLEQFASLDDRLAICGYGTPDAELATACTRDRATVIIEDEMPNGVVIQVPKKKKPKRKTTSPTEPKLERRAKFFRLPLDEELLLDHAAQEVEVRVTLSYFPEVHTHRRRSFRGMDLRWDMQGPTESEEQFRWRVNKIVRQQKTIKPGKSFDWDIGPGRREKGTVQTDRWRGEASLLHGPKLIAVMPVGGWWNERRQFWERTQPFSLIVSVVSPGIPLYAGIRAAIETSIDAAEIEIEI